MTTPTKPTTRIAIVGSREYEHMDKVREFVQQIAEDYDKKVVIVSGGARGVDTIAIDEAMRCGLGIQVWHADWNRHGKRAGILRNYDIINDAEQVAAFWDEESRGTSHSMRISRDREKLWKVFGADAQEMEIEELDLS